MACAFRFVCFDFDAEVTQALNEVGTLDEVVAAPVHVEVVYLLVEVVCFCKLSVVGSLYVKSEDGSTKGAHPCELVHVIHDDVESLVTTP